MILIRADANEKIGSGHMMRCLSIARAFADKGKTVKFITADHKGDSLIYDKGVSAVCLSSDWSKMESEGIESEVKKYRPDLLLVDSYYITESYLQSLSEVTRLAYIDDINLAQWNVDYLVNYNIFGTVMDYSKYMGSNTTVMCGTRYVPLRDEFQGITEHEIKSVTDVMISAGGADPERITEKFIIDVCSAFENIRFHLVVGALNPRLKEIKAMLTDNIIMHENENNMSGLMRSCDIAISAAGSTLYELCACGTPTITYTLADNQVMAAEEYEKQGLMINAGDCRNNKTFAQTIRKELKRLIDDPSKRKLLSTSMQVLVDGRGAERIVEEIWDNMVVEAREAVKDEYSIHMAIDNRWMAIGKTKNGRILAVIFQMSDSEEIILHSCIANAVEVKLYYGE